MDLGYLLLLSLLLILSLPYLRISPPPPPNFPPHPLPPPNAPPKPPPPDEDADDPPNKSKEFEELGANPTRTKTISNHTAAVKLLNEFLTAKGMSPLPAKPTDNYSENVCKEKDVCTLSFMRQLATFIKEAQDPLLPGQTPEDKSWRFRPGPGKNKLGDIKGQIERIFGKECWLHNDRVNCSVSGTRWNEKGSDAWFSILRKNLNDEMFYRCYQNGNPTVWICYLLF